MEKRERGKWWRERFTSSMRSSQTPGFSLSTWKNSSRFQNCVKFHTRFSQHILICTVLFLVPPSIRPSLALGSVYEILSFSFIRCCQTRPPCQSWLNDSTYNFPPAICPLKRKIALDRTSPSKTTTINGYDCNGIGAVSPGPGRAFSHIEKRCFKPTLPCNIYTCAKPSAPPILP